MKETTEQETTEQEDLQQGLNLVCGMLVDWVDGVADDLVDEGVIQQMPYEELEFELWDTISMAVAKTGMMHRRSCPTMRRPQICIVSNHKSSRYLPPWHHRASLSRVTS